MPQEVNVGRTHIARRVLYGDLAKANDPAILQLLKRISADVLRSRDYSSETRGFAMLFGVGTTPVRPILSERIFKW